MGFVGAERDALPALKAKGSGSGRIEDWTKSDSETGTWEVTGNAL
jgi:hypothetical protein